MDMLTFNFQPNNTTPLYQQLYEYIKSQIQLGKIVCNEKLPSKRKLSTYLKISQNTIQAAYSQLVEEGYVIPIEKKGFYVTKLENVIALGSFNENIPKVENKINREIKYDFSYDGVDIESFPFSKWARLTKEEIYSYDNERLKLGDAQGNLNLRNSIAKYLYHSRGVNCDASQIIISAGTEFLFQILIQLFYEDDIYGIENPGYEKLNLLFQSNRAQYRPIDIDKSGMVLDEIIKSRCNILCVTPSHQFPSGCIMPINRRIQLLNWAYECDRRYIIEDDYDSEFKYNGKPIPSLQGMDKNNRVIYMGTFSKSLSPSIRVSYMVLPEPLLKNYLQKLSYIVCPVPSMEQKVLHRFIEEGHFERHLNKMRTIYKKKRETLVGEILKPRRDIKVIGADAGLHLLLKVKNGMSEKQLVESALKAGVKVYGVSQYYFDHHAKESISTVLLGYATMKKKEMIEAVDILHNVW